MTHLVTAGAQLRCAFGQVQSTLGVPLFKRVVSGTPAATIADHLPLVNIPSFGMCNCPSNPMVAIATASALGVPTPAPCLPNTLTPWVPGSPAVSIGNVPALQDASIAMCSWGGLIRVVTPAQFTTTLP
ncbi:hypothetical protein WM40_14800 [Robbsia andropogonis]|uniref:DUF4280 domain-containing protein n=1 Tax=Robbsia andropogonis TaxID=28092 RepID=A0A0F5JYF2_9BURK|nr:DUF4280 domain-containing protein [Robbsia andropogonis]KKB62863.1 hypothetical protein WM40_14800 [Robbsia andropogonis]MCP1118037.1 DUF4280 domain-containing protein [Robbsia andropogonis]MCP1127682.1 DUF4280 domain-containing protein [Robbsia andropogonis]